LSLILTASSARAGLIIDNQLFSLDPKTKSVSTESAARYQLSISIGASIPKLYFIGRNGDRTHFRTRSV
jgi:hypothetical protein